MSPLQQNHSTHPTVPPPQKEEPSSFLSRIGAGVISAVSWMYNCLPSLNFFQRKVSVEITPSSEIESITQQHFHVSDSQREEESEPTTSAPFELLKEDEPTTKAQEVKQTKTEKKRLKNQKKALRTTEEAAKQLEQRGSGGGAASATAIAGNATRAAFQDFVTSILSRQDRQFIAQDRVSRWSNIESLEQIRDFPDTTLSGEENRYDRIWQSHPKLGPIWVAEQQVRHDFSMIEKLFKSQTFWGRYLVQSGRSIGDNTTYFIKVKLINKGAGIKEEKWGVATVILNKKNEVYHFYCDSNEDITRRKHEGTLRELADALPFLRLDEELDLAREPVPIQSEKKQKRVYYEIPQNNSHHPPIIMVVNNHPLTGLTCLFIAPIHREEN